MHHIERGAKRILLPTKFQITHLVKSSVNGTFRVTLPASHQVASSSHQANSEEEVVVGPGKLQRISGSAARDSANIEHLCRMAQECSKIYSWP